MGETPCRGGAAGNARRRGRARAARGASRRPSPRPPTGGGLSSWCSGIGRAAAVELAKHGANVVPVGRDRKRTASIARKVGAEPVQADFSSLADVRRVADLLLERHERIDVLVNNAGLVAGRRRLTADGLELTMAVNHFAPFLLTNLLLERLKEYGPARVVTTASDAHRGGLLDM